MECNQHDNSDDDDDDDRFFRNVVVVGVDIVDEFALVFEVVVAVVDVLFRKAFLDNERNGIFDIIVVVWIE